MKCEGLSLSFDALPSSKSLSSTQKDLPIDLDIVRRQYDPEAHQIALTCSIVARGILILIDKIGLLTEFLRFLSELNNFW
jgi:hypothetical protein